MVVQGGSTKKTCACLFGDVFVVEYFWGKGGDCARVLRFMSVMIATSASESAMIGCVYRNKGWLQVLLRVRRVVVCKRIVALCDTLNHGIAVLVCISFFTSLLLPQK